MPARALASPCRSGLYTATSLPEWKILKKTGFPRSTATSQPTTRKARLSFPTRFRSGSRGTNLSLRPSSAWDTRLNKVRSTSATGCLGLSKTPRPAARTHDHRRKRAMTSRHQARGPVANASHGQLGLWRGTGGRSGSGLVFGRDAQAEERRYRSATRHEPCLGKR
jgi:hypothetical protein